MPLITSRPFFSKEPYRSIILADTPWGYWKWDETSAASPAADETGNGHVGSYQNGADPNTTQIIDVSRDAGGSAVSFPGADDYVDITGTVSSIPFNNSSWTIEVWKRTLVDSRTFRLFDNRGTGAFGTVTGIQISCSSAVIRWGNTTIDDGAGNYIGGTGSSWDGLPYNEKDGNPHLITLTFDNTTGTGRFYIDGVLQGSPETNANLIGKDFRNNTPYWGRAVNVTTQSYQGDLDEGAIYAYALSPAQVLSHYNSAF